MLRKKHPSSKEVGKRCEQFAKEEIRKVNKHKERYATPLFIKET